MRDREQFSHLSRKLLPHDSNVLLQAYLHVTEAPQVYVLLDLSEDTNDSLRLRNCIFPNEAPPLIYVDIGNETHKGKLPDSSLIKKMLGQNYVSHHIEL